MMCKKVLFTANTLRHLYLCHIPYMGYFKNMGYEVHTASDSDGILNNVDKSYKLSIKRNPFTFYNIKAVFELKKIIEKERYEIIHTHTPMGAVVTRIALKLTKMKNIKILYTAHGLHFFKGCSFKNYILYYPIEKILSKYTDMIITINKEDYNFAKEHFNTKIRYIPGIGFDEYKFKDKLNKKEKNEFRKSIGLNTDDYVISYVAEISKRKRHNYLLEVISKMNVTNEKFLFIGDDSRIGLIQKYVKKYKLQDVVKIIGFSNDIVKYLDISDLVISVSMQEGLPLNIMEAMYKEKPIIVTDCRGNRDLIKNRVNGIVVGLDNKEELICAIDELKNDKKLASRLGKKNKNIIDKYSIVSVFVKMEKIYQELLRMQK